VVKDIPRLVRVLEARGVTRMVLVPSLLQAMLEEEDVGERLKKLRVWTTSGEKLPQELAERFREKLPKAKLLNLYGSTEIAADATGTEVKEGERVTIGRPLSNVKAYVLDAALRPVAVGMRGELYVGGEGVARGYLNRPDLTAERFIPDEYSGVEGARLYRTGDVVRHLEDGRLEYLGRRDAQVKGRGFRIELGEVGAALAERPDLAVLDIDLPGLDGITAASRLHERLPACRVVILTVLGRPGQLRAALDAHVAGFMVKDTPSDQLIDVLRKVAAGERVIDPKLALATLEMKESPLSERETDVLRRFAAGADLPAIAAELFLSYGTVRNYMASAVTKLGGRNRMDAVRIATDAGWL
jgi:two-component system response regulator DesR